MTHLSKYDVDFFFPRVRFSDTPRCAATSRGARVDPSKYLVSDGADTSAPASPMVPPRRRFRKTFFCTRRETKCPTRRAIAHRPRHAAAACFLTGFSVMTKHGGRAVSRPLVARVQTRLASARMRTSPRTCRRHTTTPPAIFFTWLCRRRPVRFHHEADGHRPGVRPRQRECRARRA